MRWVLPGFRGVRPGTLREAFQTFRPSLRGQGRGLLAGALLTLLATGFELLRPWPLKLVFDEVLLPLAGGGSAAADRSGIELLLVGAAGSLVLIAAMAGSLNVWRTVAVARVGRKVATRVRRQIFEHLHRLALPFHISSRSGDLLMRLMGDVNMVRDLVFASWISLLGRGLLFAGIAVVMMVLHPLLALLALAPVPGLLFTLRRSSRKLSDVTRKQRRKEGGAAAMAAETLRQIRLVKAYASEGRATREFTRHSRAGERAGAKAARLAAGMGRQSELLASFGVAAVLLVGARSVLDGVLTPGELLVLVSYTRSLYKPLRGLTKEGARLAKASACAERLLEVLRIPAEPADSGRQAPAFAGRIAFRDVTYTWPGGVTAVRDLSFDIEPGALAALTGPNGSGKSTALSLLLRLVEPDRGSILVDGREVSGYSLDSYRSRFAYVPQEVQLFGATVRENILYGRPDAGEEEIRSAAELALLDGVVARLPRGYDTVLEEAGASLSGGEARRLMLARSALRDARILLLDEPLAGLDPEAAATVARAVRRVASGRTALVISHGDVDALEPDILLHLEAGRLARVRRRSLEVRS